MSTFRVSTQDEQTPDTMRRMLMLAPVRFLPAWLVLLVAPVVFIAGTHRWAGVVSTAAWALSWMTLDVGFGLPRAVGLPTWWRWLSLAALLTAVAARIAAADLAGGFVLTDLLGPALLLVLLLGWGYDLRACVRRPSPLLHWPLPAGRWLVAQGNNRIFNHHWPAARQRAALDIVGLTAARRSFHGCSPRRFDQFAIAGAPVRSPLQGRVIVASDQAPMWPGAGVPATGNHVVIDGGNCRVLLAHLVPGSLQVAEGDQIHHGDPIGLVGTSGNSTQPHLHIHAIDDQGPLRLRFHEVTGVGRRGRIIRLRD